MSGVSWYLKGSGGTGMISGDCGGEDCSVSGGLWLLSACVVGVCVLGNGGGGGGGAADWGDGGVSCGVSDCCSAAVL